MYVAAINGTCAGAGLGLALACDIRIAVEGARFVTAFTSIGLTPDSGLSATLARAVGAARASELVLLAEPFTATEAKQWGLIGRTVPADELTTAVCTITKRLAAGPTQAYAAAKGAMRNAWAASMAEVLAQEGHDQRTLGITPDHHAAVQAFLAKRAPRFA